MADASRVSIANARPLGHRVQAFTAHAENKSGFQGKRLQASPGTMLRKKPPVSARPDPLGDDLVSHIFCFFERIASALSERSFCGALVLFSLLNRGALGRMCTPT